MEDNDALDDHQSVHERLRALGSRPVDPAVQSAHLTAMAAVAARPRATWAHKARVAAAFGAGLILGGTGLAAADALPDPAQRVAHSVLGQVGVDVPKPERYHGEECGPEAKGNHGAYVRDDPSLSRSACGKPVHAGQGGDKETKGAGRPDKGPCQGRPPWAGRPDLTEEERTALQNERLEQCGPDEDESVESDDGTTG